jgi:hypothetical protein
VRPFSRMDRETRSTEKPACAAFRRERRMKCINTTNLNRNPGERSRWICSFRGPFLEMFFDRAQRSRSQRGGPVLSCASGGWWREPQVPYDFAQGRLSTSLRSGPTARRDRRDDNSYLGTGCECPRKIVIPNKVTNSRENNRVGRDPPPRLPLSGGYSFLLRLEVFLCKRCMRRAELGDRDSCRRAGNVV